MKKLILLFLIPFTLCGQITTTNFEAILDGSLQYYRPGWSTNELFNYSLIEIYPSVDGLYDIINPSANLSLTNDPYIYVYENTFDPQNPQVNLIAYDDDSNGNLLFRINEIEFFSTITYILVATSYQPGATGTFNVTIQGEGSVQYGGSVTTPSIPEPSMMAFLFGVVVLGYLIHRRIS